MSNEPTDPNPYQSAGPISTSHSTRSTKWLVWAGVVCCVLAMLCLGFSMGAMVSSFQTVAESDTMPSPQVLADDISRAVIPIYVGVPLGLLGIGLVVAGFVIRRPDRG